MKQVKQITIKEDVNFNFVLSTTDVSRRQEMTNMHCLLEKADDDRIFDLLEGKIDVGIQKCLSKIKVMKAELFKKMIYETEVPLLINQHGIIYKGLDITNNLKSLL
jgi:hypothetical protein